MADSKISALTDGGGLLPGDELAINRSGTSYKARGIGTDGWIDDTAETWTYASGSGGGTATFTVTGDLTATYTPGTRIKLTQTTVKYFVVAASSVAAGTTTVTITAGSDYTLANAAISANYHSYESTPQGYPGWFNFSPNSQGFSSLTQDLARFCVVGRIVYIKYESAGTSNATTFTWTAPIATGSSTLVPLSLTRVTDNGTATFVGAFRMAASSTTITMGKALNGPGGFTNSGGKGASGSFFYEI